MSVIEKNFGYNYIELEMASILLQILGKQRMYAIEQIWNKETLQRILIVFNHCFTWYISDVPDWSLPFLSTFSQSNETQTSGKAQFRA